MIGIEHEKTRDTERQLPCKNCGRYTFHTVLHSVEKHEREESFGPAAYFDLWYEFEIVMCQGCREISFCKITSNSEDLIDDPETGEVILDKKVSLYPNRIAGRKPLDAVSSLSYNVRKLYEETHATLCSQYHILAGIGIRTLVESVCSEESAVGTNLEQKIDDLVTKGVLTKDNADILHTTRLMGNKAAHEFISAQQHEIDVAMDIVENLLMTVYIIPSKAKWLKK